MALVNTLNVPALKREVQRCAEQWPASGVWPDVLALIALLEQAGAALAKARKPASWAVVEFNEPESLLVEHDAALAALRAAGVECKP